MKIIILYYHSFNYHPYFFFAPTTFWWKYQLISIYLIIVKPTGAIRAWNQSSFEKMVFPSCIEFCMLPIQAISISLEDKHKNLLIFVIVQGDGRPTNRVKIWSTQGIYFSLLYSTIQFEKRFLLTRRQLCCYIMKILILPITPRFKVMLCCTCYSLNLKNIKWILVNRPKLSHKTSYIQSIRFLFHFCREIIWAVMTTCSSLITLLRPFFETAVDVIWINSPVFVVKPTWCVCKPWINGISKLRLYED